MHLQHSTRADILARNHRLGEVASRPAPGAAAAEQIGPTAAAADQASDIKLDPAVVKAVQRELSLRGYKPGPTDGLVHPITRAAVMAFEHDHGLPLTGEPSEELFKSILFGLPAGASAAGARDPLPQAQEIIRSVQQALAALGYRVSRIDGRMGEETSRAIRAFESQHRLTPSGRISGTLLLELEKATVRRQ